MTRAGAGRIPKLYGLADRESLAGEPLVAIGGIDESLRLMAVAQECA